MGHTGLTINVETLKIKDSTMSVLVLSSAFNSVFSWLGNWGFVTNSTFLMSITLLPLIFQTMNSVRPNNLSLKYQRFSSSDCKDIGIRQFEFVTKTQFL